MFEKDFNTNPDFPQVRDLEPSALLEIMKTQGFEKAGLHVLDVRQPTEYEGELGHISGAKLLVLDTLPQRLTEIPKDKTIICVCRSGGRSARASAFLLSNGWKNVFNLRGGMLLWNENQFPIE